MAGLARLGYAAMIFTALTAAPATGFAYTGQELAGEAQFSLPKARAIALNAVPGRIIDEELEKEPGGSGLRYAFDITLDGAIHEVGVDAQTGALLKSALEGHHPD
jgi:uncharacterized membrane protein YkoI